MIDLGSPARRLGLMKSVVAAARWAHDKLNEDHDTCDCTCVACCGCFTEWLGDHKNYEEWCPLGAALRDLDAAYPPDPDLNDELGRLRSTLDDLPTGGWDDPAVVVRSENRTSDEQR